MTVVSLVVGVLALVWLAQRWFIYFPENHPPPPRAVGLPDAEDVQFETEDGLALHAWFVPPSTAPTGQTVIVFPGNAGHRAMRAPLAQALAAHGLAVLIAEYRGYGGNPGLPSERGLARDARAAVAYVEARPDVDPARIVYFGESLGAGVAVALASARRPSALILRSPFTSLADIGAYHYPFLPVRWLLRDRYAAVDRIADLGVPLLVVAGTGDRIVPFEHSEALYDAASEPKWLATIEGADHNDDALLDGPGMMLPVVKFLAGVRQ